VNHFFEINLSINPLRDKTLLAFLCVLLIVVIFCSGAYPGLILARFQPVVALKGKVALQTPGGFSLRKGLVVGQFAISQLLIIGTLVITNQLRYSQQADMGFQKEAVVIVPVPDNQHTKINTLANELDRLPGVETATFFDTPPASDAIGSSNIHFDTRPEPEKFSISIKAADDQYVAMFGIPLIAGRNLLPSDTIREYLLNETAIKALGLKTSDDAVGKPATINGRRGTIVGVVKDFHFRSLRMAIEPLCLTTRSEVYGSCGLKINLSTMASTISRLQTEWSKIYPSSIFTYRFLNEDIERFYKLDNMLLRLIQAFAAVAIFVGCLGLYGLVSFMANQKTKEIGVRKVLGANTSDILWLFGKEFIQLLFIAFLLAAPLAWWVMHSWLSDFAYHIEPGAGIFVVAIITSLSVASLTVAFRSIKASMINPIKTLRSD
jgi:ABC-type antimicrobial peptide transport system permease subunit